MTLWSIYLYSLMHTLPSFWREMLRSDEFLLIPSKTLVSYPSSINSTQEIQRGGDVGLQSYNPDKSQRCCKYFSCFETELGQPSGAICLIILLRRSYLVKNRWKWWEQSFLSFLFWGTILVSWPLSLCTRKRVCNFRYVCDTCWT